MSSDEKRTERAVALEVQHRDGSAWVSADSLVDMFESMTAGVSGGPVESSMRMLADTFRDMSDTYRKPSQQRTKFDDGSTLMVRRCQCGAAVIDGNRMGGEKLTVNAEADPAGVWFPMKIRYGVPLLAPYGDHLDGAVGVRLTEHSCGGRR